MPCIIVTNTGNKTGAVRKTPLMRVGVGDAYVLAGWYGGRKKDPVCVYNLRANPNVQIRDNTEVYEMRVREVTGDAERAELWAASAEARNGPRKLDSALSEIFLRFQATNLTLA